MSIMVDAFGEPDLSSGQWGDFAALFANGADGMLSDGEVVDITKGTNGILKVWRASRGRRTS
jgi:hypothetical protein